MSNAEIDRPVNQGRHGNGIGCQFAVPLKKLILSMAETAE